MSAPDAVVVVRRSALVSALHSGWRCAGLPFDAALSAAKADVEDLAVGVRPIGTADVMDALARLDAAVAALAAERDALRDRIARAVAELDAAPDIDPEKAGKQRVREVVQANTRAWAVLMEGSDPPSVRREQDAPQFPREK